MFGCVHTATMFSLAALALVPKQTALLGTGLMHALSPRYRQGTWDLLVS
jgi:hypothetical protein